jgi:hypothetical protein
MTPTDFNHLLSSIKALTSEQARRLRQQLDRQVAKKNRPANQPNAPNLLRLQRNR